MYWTYALDCAPTRVNHSAVVISDWIYSFGGYTSNEPLPHVIDVHVFDTVTLCWSPVDFSDKNAPPGLYGHSVVAHGRKIYVWGGQSRVTPSNRLFCFDTVEMEWSKPVTTGQVPHVADGHSACVIGDYMYVFGGYQQGLERFGVDVYRINLLNFHWERVMTTGTRPDSRDFHTASAIGECMYIFGGRSCHNIFEGELEEEYYCNDIMYLDTRTMAWEMPICHGTPPCGRRSHSASVYKNEIYVIGGYESITEQHLNDVYKFNPATNVWAQLEVRGTGPSPRRRHCACVVGDQLYLFGGSSPTDIRTWNSSAFLINPKLVEHSDLHILEFFPSLKRLAQLEIIKSERGLALNLLPSSLKREIEAMTKKKGLVEIPTISVQPNFMEDL